VTVDSHAVIFSVDISQLVCSRLFSTFDINMCLLGPVGFLGVWAQLDLYRNAHRVLSAEHFIPNILCPIARATKGIENRNAIQSAAVPKLTPGAFSVTRCSRNWCCRIDYSSWSR
jgi:hypothetical protein